MDVSTVEKVVILPGIVDLPDDPMVEDPEIIIVGTLVIDPRETIHRVTVLPAIDLPAIDLPEINREKTEEVTMMKDEKDIVLKEEIVITINHPVFLNMITPLLGHPMVSQALKISKYSVYDGPEALYKLLLYLS